MKKFSALGEAKKFIYNGKLINQLVQSIVLEGRKSTEVSARNFVSAISRLLRKAYKRGLKDINLDSCEQCHEFAGCSLIKSLAVGLKSNPLLKDFIPKDTEEPVQTDFFKVLPKHCHRYKRKK